MQKNSEFDFLILGAGVMGLAVARALRSRRPTSKILIIEKESAVATHASGRNSGVLHAGFYYTSDTFKAKFSIAGNRAWREFCQTRKLPLNESGKLVVPTNEAELEQLYELERRGKQNGSQIEIISAEQAKSIEPNAKVFSKALWSPLTATLDPVLTCNRLAEELTESGIQISLNETYMGRVANGIKTSTRTIEAGHIINCAGLYADKIAHEFGFGLRYTILPFKGLYLKYSKNKDDVRTNIYPVPNLKHTFLGVHFTKTVRNEIKIGPTAIPAFWRENYRWNENFRFDELWRILTLEAKLFLRNSFGFRDLALEEMKKYSKAHLVKLSEKLLHGCDPAGFTQFGLPGIRAQLVDKEKSQLVMDFIVEGDSRSTHFLNAISPGFTCSIPFAEHVLAERILLEPRESAYIH